MSKLEQLDKNRVIKASGYQAPDEVQLASRVHLTKGHWLLIGLALLCVLFIAFITFARSIQISTVTQDLENPELLLPQSADVKVRSWIKFPVGNRVMLLSGKHDIHITAEGFETLTQTIDVGPERYHEFELQLKPLPGELDVKLIPPVEATVMLNGEKIGNVPGLVKSVPAGKHQITIDAPLYREKTKEVLVQGRGARQPLSFTLDPAWAEVSFDSQPSGATVLIDGVELGITPAILKVEEGLRELEVRADKFKSFGQQLTITAEQNLQLPTIELQPADGILEITTDPAEAAVVVNGNYRGVSPMTLNLKPNEAQQLQVYRGGYKLAAKEVQLLADEKRTERIVLNPDLVNVRFSVTPSDADIYVDGVRKGQGTQTVSMTTLPHQISIRKNGYVSYTNQIIPTKSSDQIITVNLLTEEEYFWANIPDRYQTNGGQDMVLFKSPGNVKMGSSRREDGRRANEVTYTAKLSRHFYVSEHEVTNKQFRAFKPTHSSGNYKKKSLDSNKHPVVNVSWQQAALYCNWLSKQEGLDPFYQTKSGYVSGNNVDANGYRLLTEVEWAWLARNKESETIRYPWGNSDSPNTVKPIDNFADINADHLVAFTLDNYDDGYQASSPVGRFPPNHRGLYDMGGNVSEWVNDWYSARANLELGQSEELVDPLGPDIGEFHVVRGGSWARGHLPQLRLAYRDFGAKGKHDIGFRIARYVGRSK